MVKYKSYNEFTDALVKYAHERLGDKLANSVKRINAESKKSGKPTLELAIDEVIRECAIEFNWSPEKIRYALLFELL